MQLRLVQAGWMSLLAILMSSTPVSFGATTDPPSGVKVKKDIIYGHSPEQRDKSKSVNLVLDAYSPEDPAKTNKAAVVLIHGNPGDAPYPGDRRSAFTSTAQILASRGYCCFVVSYQVCCGADEVKTSVRWVRANATQYGIDPNRIAAVGHSLGGSHAVTLDITGDSEEMTALKDDPTNNATLSAKVAAAVCLAGGIFQPEAVDPSDGPILFIQGTEDDVNSRDWVKKIVAGCQKSGLACPVYWIDKADHGLDLLNRKGDGRALIDLVDQFLQIHVLRTPSTEMATLAIQIDGNGSVTYDPPYGMYTKGTLVTVSATPGPEAVFSRWEGDGTGTSAATTIKMDTNKRIKAVFNAR